MKYSRKDLYEGFKFKISNDLFSSPDSILTIEKINLNRFNVPTVFCERNASGTVYYKLIYILDKLNDGTIKEFITKKENYEIF